jgi:PilZ domain
VGKDAGLVCLGVDARGWSAAFGGLVGLLHGGFIVGLANDVSFSTRMRHIRAGIRLNSRINLRVEWKEHRQTLSADGYTVDISPKGCLAIVAQGFPLGQKMVVTNVLNGKAAVATLVWRGHEGRQGWELGLELDSPAADFWGVEF